MSAAPVLEALHVRFTVDGRWPWEWWAPLRSMLTTAPGDSPRRYSVRRTDAGIELSSPDGLVGRGSAATVLGLLLDEVRGLARGPEHEVVLHAAALRRGDDILVVPGVSGAGKSTLAAHLLRAGWQLLSDELVGVDGAGVVSPCPLPLRLAPDACARLRLPAPTRLPKGDVALSALTTREPARGGRVTAIVVPYRRPDAAAGVTAMTRGHAVAVLANSVFAGVDPEVALPALAALAADARCLRLDSGDPVDACEALLAAWPTAGSQPADLPPRLVGARG